MDRNKRIEAFSDFLLPLYPSPDSSLSQDHLDLYTFRQLTLGGIPDDPSWIRPVAWKVLLGYLPAERKAWREIVRKRREEYYSFVADFLSFSRLRQTHLPPTPDGRLSPLDALLDQIYKDVARVRGAQLGWFRRPVGVSRVCPLKPAPDQKTVPSRIETRFALLQRLAEIEPDFVVAELEAREQGQGQPFGQKDGAGGLASREVREQHDLSSASTPGGLSSPDPSGGGGPSPPFLSPNLDQSPPRSRGGRSMERHLSTSTMASSFDIEAYYNRSEGEGEGGAEVRRGGRVNKVEVDSSGGDGNEETRSESASSSYEEASLERDEEEARRRFSEGALVDGYAREGGDVEGSEDEADQKLDSKRDSATDARPQLGPPFGLVETNVDARIDDDQGEATTLEVPPELDRDDLITPRPANFGPSTPRGNLKAVGTPPIVLQPPTPAAGFKKIPSAVAESDESPPPPTPSKHPRSSSASSLSKSFTFHSASASPLPPIPQKQPLQPLQTAPIVPTLPPNWAFVDAHWHSLLRILYLHSLLNPSSPYTQGQHEIAFVLLYVFAQKQAPVKGMGRADQDADRDSDADAEHAEADAFWAYGALLAEMRGVLDWAQADSTSNPNPSAGLREGETLDRALKKFGMRLKWLDEELWVDLHRKRLDPRLPYYSFRWLTCLLSTELSLPAVLRVWDAVLAEKMEGEAKIDFLLDVCCALLLNVRGDLLGTGRRLARTNRMQREAEEVEEASNYDGVGAGGDDDPDTGFSRGMKLLQNYPDEDIGPVLELAYMIKQRRLAAAMTGEGPSEEAEWEDDGMYGELDGASRSHANSVAGGVAALRNWASGPTGSPASAFRQRWFGGRSEQGEEQQRLSQSDSQSSLSDNGMSPASLFRRYADSFNRSDAAASFAKTSTNLSAAALATWRGSDAQQSSGATWSPTALSRARSPSSASTSTVSSLMSSTNLSNLWNGRGRRQRDSVPNFPLPTFRPDSPPGRFQSPSSPRQSASFSWGHSSPHTPLGGTASRRDSRESTGSGTRSGPRPLLLSSSARKAIPAFINNANPEQKSPNDLLYSRKVGTGPLASPQPRTPKSGGYASDTVLSPTVMSSNGSVSSRPSSPRESRDLSLAPSLFDKAPIAPPARQWSAANSAYTVTNKRSSRVPASFFARARAGSINGPGGPDGNRERVFGSVPSSSDRPLVDGHRRAPMPGLTRASSRESHRTASTRSTASVLTSRSVRDSVGDLQQRKAIEGRPRGSVTGKNMVEEREDSPSHQRSSPIRNIGTRESSASPTTPSGDAFTSIAHVTRTSLSSDDDGVESYATEEGSGSGGAARSRSSGNSIAAFSDWSQARVARAAADGDYDSSRGSAGWRSQEYGSSSRPSSMTSQSNVEVISPSAETAASVGVDPSTLCKLTGELDGIERPSSDANTPTGEPPGSVMAGISKTDRPAYTLSDAPVPSENGTKQAEARASRTLSHKGTFGDLGGASSHGTFTSPADAPAVPGRRGSSSSSYASRSQSIRNSSGGGISRKTRTLTRRSTKSSDDGSGTISSRRGTGSSFEASFTQPPLPADEEEMEEVLSEPTTPILPKSPRLPEDEVRRKLAAGFI